MGHLFLFFELEYRRIVSKQLSFPFLFVCCFSSAFFFFLLFVYFMYSTCFSSGLSGSKFVRLKHVGLDCSTGARGT
jgi:hypothetical protein